MSSIQSLYFIMDATHSDFIEARIEAAVSQAVRQPGSSLSWGYNFDNTRVQAKVIGDKEDWYKNVTWYNHPMILGVYSQGGVFGYEDHSLFSGIISSPEWTGYTGSPTGSPGGSPL